MRIDGSIQAVAQQRAEIVRKAVGIDAFALDQARVAERGLLGAAAPVDQHHRAAARLQVQGGADADDPGAEDDGVRFHGCGSLRATRWENFSTLTTTRSCRPSPISSLSSSALTFRKTVRPSTLTISAVARTFIPTGVAAIWRTLSTVPRLW